MSLVNVETSVILKILENFVSMQNSLNANNCSRKEIWKTDQGDLTFILNVNWESSIHFVYFSIVLAKKDVVSFT